MLKRDHSAFLKQGVFDNFYIMISPCFQKTEWSLFSSTTCKGAFPIELFILSILLIFDFLSLWTLCSLANEESGWWKFFLTWRHYPATPLGLISLCQIDLLVGSVPWGDGKSPFWPESALFPQVLIFCKLPTFSQVCLFAKNQTCEKIIEFSLKSDFCNHLLVLSPTTLPGFSQIDFALR